MIPLSDTKGSGSFPFWVICIILINCLVFFFEIISPNSDQFIQKYALIPTAVNFSDYSSLLPFITSQFLHAGFLHIISNMWFVWIFGDNVEQRLGFLLFPLIYLLSGVVGGLAQYLLMPDSIVPTIGASGAVAGVLGAYFALFPNHCIKTVVPIFGFFTITDLPAAFVLVYWFITQIFSGTAALVATSYQLGGVAYFAHIAGFVFGYLIAKLLTLTLLKTLGTT
jgi:membrane associated rhomboid family serine protease